MPMIDRAMRQAVELTGDILVRRCVRHVAEGLGPCLPRADAGAEPVELAGADQH